jgi:hypothetical protein
MLPEIVHFDWSLVPLYSPVRVRKRGQKKGLPAPPEDQETVDDPRGIR